ncbi:MAG: hypothetical protein DMG73_18795 [Acidobacteria bacterium]|nr:MAG: hypothetical protein DMG73_18795 [Acidobacteriota bacterium]PYX63166.1 MAG: hypothetical protein DMG74_18030 [Acidobacteriota bacterium]
MHASVLLYIVTFVTLVFRNTFIVLTSRIHIFSAKIQAERSFSNSLNELETAGFACRSCRWKKQQGPQKI